MDPLPTKKKAIRKIHSPSAMRETSKNEQTRYCPVQNLGNYSSLAQEKQQYTFYM